VITSVQRRRWSAEEKAAIVQETYAPGISVFQNSRILLKKSHFPQRTYFSTVSITAAG
jgi:Transposase